MPCFLLSYVDDTSEWVSCYHRNSTSTDVRPVSILEPPRRDPLSLLANQRPQRFLIRRKKLGYPLVIDVCDDDLADLTAIALYFRGAGVEPAPSYEERILSKTKVSLPDLTKRDEPIYRTGSRQSHALFVRLLDRVPEKLSQHRHKKDPALYTAVVNLLIPLVNGGWHEARG